MGRRFISEIDHFIKESIARGKTYPEIESVLLEAGWPKKSIDNALQFYHQTNYPLAVPKHRLEVSPRMAALNLFYFLVFYVTLCTLTFIIYTILDHNMPDGHGRMDGIFYGSDLRDDLKNYLSIIIVSAPLTLFTGDLFKKAVAETGQAAPGIRMVLIYVSLLIGGIILLITASMFVYYLLDGTLSARFMIKFALLTLKFFAIYYYFRPELRNNEAVA